MGLEAMSVVLQETNAENEKLKEEMEACAVAHARDVGVLEEMLQQLTAGHKPAQACGKGETQLLCTKSENIDDIGTGCISSLPASIESTKEPEREESPNLDKTCSVYPRIQLVRTPRDMQ